MVNDSQHQDESSPRSQLTPRITVQGMLLIVAAIAFIFAVCRNVPLLYVPAAIFILQSMVTYISFWVLESINSNDE